MSLGRSWGYAGVELRLVDGELIDPAMPASARARVKRTLAAAGLPAVAVDSSIRLTGEDPGAELLAQVDSAAVGAVWDSHHPYRMGERAADVWANLGPRPGEADARRGRPPGGGG